MRGFFVSLKNKPFGMKQLATLFAALSFLLPLSAQTIEEQLDAIGNDFNLMGMSVVALCDGEPVLVHHFGTRDFTRDLPVNDATQYRIASISKAITATGLMLLVEDGLIDLDADISNYLGFTARNPQYPNTVVTVRMVASHTSSIQDGSGYNGFLNATYAATDDMPGMNEILSEDGNFFTSNIWRTETPGSFFAYSNLNYGVLATIMEAASGQRFDVFMRERLFEPLGLTCSYNVADLPDIDNLAVLYRNQGGWTPQVDNFQGAAPEQPALSGYVPGTNGSRFAPQGGLRASALDLATLAQLHLGNVQLTYNGAPAFTESTRTLMHTAVWSYNGNNGDNYFNLFNEWGLGVQRVTNTPMGDRVFPDLDDVIGHPGEAYGLISDWYFSPSTGKGIVFMTNGAFNGFSFGANSAFYTLEEAIFSAIDQSFPCVQSVNEDRGEAEPMLYPNPIPAGQKPRIEIGGNGRASVFSATGQLLTTEIQIANGTLHFVPDVAGTYFISGEVDGTPFRTTLLVHP